MAGILVIICASLAFLLLIAGLTALFVFRPFSGSTLVAGTDPTDDLIYMTDLPPAPKIEKKKKDNEGPTVMLNDGIDWKKLMMLSEESFLPLPPPVIKTAPEPPAPVVVAVRNDPVLRFGGFLPIPDLGHRKARRPIQVVSYGPSPFGARLDYLTSPKYMELTSYMEARVRRKRPLDLQQALGGGGIPDLPPQERPDFRNRLRKGKAVENNQLALNKQFGSKQLEFPNQVVPDVPAPRVDGSPTVPPTAIRRGEGPANRLKRGPGINGKGNQPNTLNRNNNLKFNEGIQGQQPANNGSNGQTPPGFNKGRAAGNGQKTPGRNKTFKFKEGIGPGPTPPGFSPNPQPGPIVRPGQAQPGVSTSTPPKRGPTNQNIGPYGRRRNDNRNLQNIVPKQLPLGLVPVEENRPPAIRKGGPVAKNRKGVTTRPSRKKGTVTVPGPRPTPTKIEPTTKVQRKPQQAQQPKKRDQKPSVEKKTRSRGADRGRLSGGLALSGAGRERENASRRERSQAESNVESLGSLLDRHTGPRFGQEAPLRKGSNR